MDEGGGYGVVEQRVGDGELPGGKAFTRPYESVSGRAERVVLVLLRLFRAATSAPPGRAGIIIVEEDGADAERPVEREGRERPGGVALSVLIGAGDQVVGRERACRAGTGNMTSSFGEVHGERGGGRGMAAGDAGGVAMKDLKELAGTACVQVLIRGSRGTFFRAGCVGRW